MISESPSSGTSKYHLVAPLPDGRAALVLGGAGWDGLGAEVEVDSGVIMSSCHHVIMSSYYHVIILSYYHVII